MENNNSLFSDWRSWLKYGMIVVTILYLVKQVLSFIFLNQSTQFISSVVSKQKKEAEPFQREVKQHIASVQNNMEKIDLAIEKGVDHMADRVDKFQQEFNEDFDRLQQESKKNDASWKDFKKEWRKEMLKESNFDRDMNKYWKEQHKREDAKKLKDFMIVMKPYMDCERKLFGKTSFNTKDYAFYNPFPFGLPKECKEFEKKSL